MQNSKIKNENKIERCLYCYHRITDFKNVIIHYANKKKYYLCNQNCYDKNFRSIENNKLIKQNQKLNDYLEQINVLIYNTLLLKNYVFNRADFTEKIMTILNNWAKETN